MTHDVMCPILERRATCQCQLIAKVREDERKQESARRAAKFGYWHDYRPELP